MGILSWLLAAVATFLLFRLVPLGRSRWPRELVAAMVAGALAGFLATALDFGGVAELEWRAAAFAAIAACGAIGLSRLG